MASYHYKCNRGHKFKGQENTKICAKCGSVEIQPIIGGRKRMLIWLVAFLVAVGAFTILYNGFGTEEKEPAEITSNESSDLNGNENDTSINGNAIASEELEHIDVKPKAPDADTLYWNYYGTIADYPIKAYLNFEKTTYDEGSGAINFPITGYYYYESKHKKISFSGSANGLNQIYLKAIRQSKNEYFHGEGPNDAMLSDWSGTWRKGDKELPFVLNEKVKATSTVANQLDNNQWEMSYLSASTNGIIPVHLLNRPKKGTINKNDSVKITGTKFDNTYTVNDVWWDHNGNVGAIYLTIKGYTPTGKTDRTFQDKGIITLL